MATAFALLLAIAPTNASADCAETSSGGLTMSTDTCEPAAKATLVNGKAIAPASAPARVK